MGSSKVNFCLHFSIFKIILSKFCLVSRWKWIFKIDRR
jgi:hypothetical protein